MSLPVTTNDQLPARVPVVWIINEGGHQYEKAEKFGRLMPLTTGNINPFGLDRLMYMLGIRIARADAEDYVLISGLAILNAVVICMWLTKFGRIKLLQWANSRGDGHYVPLTLTLEAITRNTTQEPRVAD